VNFINRTQKKDHAMQFYQSVCFNNAQFELILCIIVQVFLSCVKKMLTKCL